MFRWDLESEIYRFYWFDVSFCLWWMIIVFANLSWSSLESKIIFLFTQVNESVECYQTTLTIFDFSQQLKHAWNQLSLILVRDLCHSVVFICPSNFLFKHLIVIVVQQKTFGAEMAYITEKCSEFSQSITNDKINQWRNERKCTSVNWNNLIFIFIFLN